MRRMTTTTTIPFTRSITRVLEQIDSSFIDGSAAPHRYWKRYHRLTDGDPWNLTSVWTQTLTVSIPPTGSKTTSPFMLAFPFPENTTWDGNDMNTLDEELYAYEDYHVSRSVNGMAFDSTLSVPNATTTTWSVFGQEIYANGVRLIRRQRDDLVSGTESL